MTNDDDTPESIRGDTTDATATPTAVSSEYKVLGHNTTANGTTYGVLGQVDSADGYGLYTPDDAKIEGTVDTAETDFTVETGTTNTGNAMNVVMGHASNSVGDNTEGATISGGGMDDGNDQSHHASDFGSIGGGQNNEAGVYATVAGGYTNVATSLYASVLGGLNNRATGRHATVAGGYQNTASGKRSFAAGWESEATGDFSTVSGGGPSDTNNPGTTNNVVHDNYGAIGGGGNNVAYNDYGTIAGGENNQVGKSGTVNSHAFVGSGVENEARAMQSAVVSGFQNETYDGALQSFVGGGYGNSTSGDRAVVPGGRDNRANGATSFAAGYGARANDSGAFVWADDQSGGTFSSDSTEASNDPTGPNTFNVRSHGGVRFVTGSSKATYISAGSTGWATSSSRAVKTDVDPVDSESVLSSVEDLEVSTWQYEDESGDGAGEVHMGPMAEDFHDAFDVGNSDEHINSINADGVAFAAIQGLSQRLAAKDERIAELEERLATLEDAVSTADGPAD